MMGALGALVATGWPGLVLACALPPSIVMTLPTGHYMWGAALAVALTGLAAGLVPRLPALTAHRLCALPSLPLVIPLSYLSTLVMGLLIGLGLWGPADPMHNLLTLVFWTGVWVALPLLSMLTGDVWRLINPWTGLVRILRLLTGRRGGIGLDRLGHWPAVAGLAGFSWFQIASISPEDPRGLALLMLGYWGGVLVLSVLEGEEWLGRGEFLTVLMRALSRISPLWIEDGRLMAGWPGAQLTRMDGMSRSEVAFVTLVLASLGFDGLRATFWWLSLVGQNPLEFAGRSAVVWSSSLGLLAAWALTWGTIRGALWLGWRWSGQALPAGPIMLSFLAIAAGYHVSHYLMLLLTAGQYTVSALNDPFLRGDSLLGLQPFWVSMGFLTDRRVMVAVWNLQFALILGAHLLAVVLAIRLSPVAARGLRAHLPLTVLMVGWTVLGLWLLASPAGV